MKNSYKILFSFIIIIIVVICFYFLIKEISKVERHDDINKYSEYLNDLISNSDAHSLLHIFPKDININKVLEFEYLTTGGMFDGSYLFYVIINYDEEELNKEIERLRSIKSTFNNEYKYVLEEDLKYKTFITICDGNGSYEYAIIDDNKIIYVFRQIFYEKNDLDDKYVLDYIVPTKLKDTRRDGYNMYYIYDKNGIGYMEEDYQK